MRCGNSQRQDISGCWSWGELIFDVVRGQMKEWGMAHMETFHSCYGARCGKWRAGGSVVYSVHGGGNPL